MDITDKTVDELAHLARLQFEGEEKERIKKDLNKILTFMEKPGPDKDIKEMRIPDNLRTSNKMKNAGKEYLASMGIRERRMTAGSVWRALAERNSDRIAPEHQRALRRILTEGTLARRLVLRLGPRPGLDALMKVYRELAGCLAENRLWP